MAISTLMPIRALSHKPPAATLMLAVTLAFAASEAPGSESPVEVLTSFYQAVAEGDCTRARDIRPGYPPERCKNKEEVEVLNVNTFFNEDQLAALEYSVRYRQKGATAVETFHGFAGMKRRDGSWIILNALVQSHRLGDAAEQASFIDLLKLNATAEPDTGLKGERVGAGVEATANAFGSRPILTACWRPAELAPQNGEDGIVRLALPDYDPPRTASAGFLTASDAPKHTRSGVVKSVGVSGGRRLVALTFNLIERVGEVSGYDAEIVNVLRELRVPSTLFITGKWMRSHRQRMQQLMADPLFEIGSLGWSYANLAVLGSQEMDEQLQWPFAQYSELRHALSKTRCVQAGLRDEMERIAPSIRLFRFPYGRCDEIALEAVSEAGLVSVQWSLALDDISHDISDEKILANVAASLQPGAILVGHADGRSHLSADALRRLISDVSARGYRFLGVSDLLDKGGWITGDTCYEHQPGENLKFDGRSSNGIL